MTFLGQVESTTNNHLGVKSGSSSVHSRRSSVHEQYEQVATRIVTEENIAKQIMPIYRDLPDYQLISKLGDGAFSKVYEAIKPTTGEKVAIKIVHKRDLGHQQKASVLKEVQIMRTLNHTSIISLLDFIETQDYYFLILELCQGGEIFHQIVRLTYFSEDLSRHCIRQVAQGIRYLHEEKGVIHRDIKPENLLFVPIDFIERVTPSVTTHVYDDEDPKEDEGEFIAGIGGGGISHVKIADFGLSKVVWDQQTRTPCGTVGYTAPEIVTDQRYSKSVDMWALGCVLYTMLCGFPPFYDENIKTLTEKVSRGEYTFLSPWWDDISDPAKDLIEHLLCVDPEARYSIDEFLEHPWMKTEDDKNNVDPADAVSPVITTTAAASNDISTETEAELYKRMIQERNRDEEELEAAVPQAVCSSSGLSSVINSRVTSRAGSRAASFIASGGAITPRRDLYSGVTSMKEMFDISYTVHRMAEEKARRKSLKSLHRKSDTNSTTRRALFMTALQDDGSYSDDDEDNTDETSSLTDVEVDLKNDLGALKINDHSHKKRHSLFQLKIENASLLTKRKIPIPSDGQSV